MKHDLFLRSNTQQADVFAEQPEPSNVLLCFILLEVSGDVAHAQSCYLPGGLPKLAAPILALAPAAPELAGGLASSPGAVGPGPPSVIGRGVYLSGAEPFARTPSGRRRRATRTPTESCLIGFSFLFRKR